MACPYFYPILNSLPPLESLPLPLGDAWSGLCHARPESPVEPEPASRVTLCHLGYARGRCARFPADDSGADAVRFAVSADTGSTLDLYYVLERDHHPFAHGPLRFSLSMRRFVEPPAAAIPLCQAEAYIESYLRRQKEAFRP